jgi:periplasmic protein TonB
MTYVQPSTNRSRASTLIVVGTIHVAAIYGIVTAFGFQLIPRPAPPPVEGRQIPTTNFLDPVPTPSASETPVIVRETFRPVPPLPPVPPIGVTTTLPPVGGGELASGLGRGDALVGGEIDVVEFPTASATPPLFTPKGPHPRGDQARWVTRDDYPTRAMNLGQEGLTRARLSVGASGRVTSCAVIESSGSALLDAAACDGLTHRARFDPATNADGENTSGTFVTTVRWELPD